MKFKFVAGCLSVGLLPLLWPVHAVAQIDWTGAGADNLWSNPDNWAGGVVPTAADRVRINGPAGEDPNGPLIADGIDAVTELLIADHGNPTVTMTGGSLELAGWGTWWGDAAGTTANFHMSGGVVNFTGSPGIMELGWQDPSDPVGSSIGSWVITDGEINAKGLDMPGKGNGGIGALALWGGTVNVGTERGGLVMYQGAEIDITEGILVLEGDQTESVIDFIDQEWIIAYSGAGELDVFYDGDFTYVVGIRQLPCDFDGDQACTIVDLDNLLFDALGTNSPQFDLDASGGPIDLGDRDEWLALSGIENGATLVLGDTDLDGKVDAVDLNNLGLNWLRDDADSWQMGDFNGDRLVNANDLNDMGLNWQHGVPVAANSVPEPAGGMMLIIALSGLLIRRP